MKFTAFKESNIYLGEGDNPNTTGIAACVCKDPTTKRDFIFGKVKFTPEEVAQIAEKGELFIGVMGRGWPPMIVTPHNPFKDFEEDSNFKPYQL